MRNYAHITSLVVFATLALSGPVVADDVDRRVVNDGNLVIDKAGVREYLNGISGYSGLIGTISCDEFGDCGSQKITIVKHDDSTDIEASKANVVFEYAPV